MWNGDARGLNVDEFRPAAFFFNAHSDFFEEIAKYRAARRIWHIAMGERFGAKEPALMGAALSYANRRLLAHRAAALQQRRSHRAAGPGRRARRHAIPAHQFARRSLGAAHRRSRHPGAAHAADDRARNRRRQHGRSAGRLRISWKALTHETERGAWDYIRQNRRHGRNGRRHRKELSAARNRRASYRYQKALDRQEKSWSA